MSKQYVHDHYVAVFNNQIVGLGDTPADARDEASLVATNGVDVYPCEQSLAFALCDKWEQQFAIVDGMACATQTTPALSHDDAIAIVCEAANRADGLAGRLGAMQGDDLHTLRSALLDAVTWGEMAADDCERLDDQIQGVM